MSGRTKGFGRFPIKFHVCLSKDMKKALVARAKADNIPEAQVVRAMLAHEFNLPEDTNVAAEYKHIFGENAPHTRVEASKHANKPLFADKPLLSVAWGKPITTKDDDE